MECIFTSPKTQVSYRDVRLVSCQTPSGDIGILKGHADMVFLVDGDVIVTLLDGTEVYLRVLQGYGHVQKNTITLLVQKLEVLPSE